MSQIIDTPEAEHEGNGHIGRRTTFLPDAFVPVQDLDMTEMESAVLTVLVRLPLPPRS